MSRIKWIKRKNKYTEKKKTVSIRNQIVGTLLLISALILTCLGTIIFFISRSNIQRNYQVTHEYNLQLFSRGIEDQLGDYVEKSRELLTNEGFKTALVDSETDEKFFAPEDSQTLERTLNNIMSDETYIRAMCVVNTKGTLRFVTKVTKDTNYMRHYYTSDNLLDESWVQMADEAKGKEVFFGYNVLFEDDDTFSVVKCLKNINDNQTMGYFVMNISKHFLEDTFQMDDEKYATNRYLILDVEDEKDVTQDGYRVVFYNGNEKEKTAVVEDYLKEKNDTYLYSTYFDSISGWDIINVIQQKELTRESSYIGWVTLAAGIILVWLVAIAADIISRRITKPLSNLEQLIEEVGEGNYQVNADFDDSEIGRVGQKFEDMAKNNLELRDRLLNSTIKEREAELLLLQSQINPHFLYNTLDALYFMAVLEDADDIADMVKSLSDTFKLSLNKGDKLISVGDDIEKIKAYMKIQNLRYRNRFDVQIEVDEDILDEKILTFILQPVVENAVYHGLEPKVGNGSISIVGYRDVDDDSKLHFIIHDNGVGIDDMEKLKKGYGVKNINERIALFYGEEYQVAFESKPDEGTTVFYDLPVVKEEEPCSQW